ncbi:MAG: hypothetical protein FWG02_04990 [Holophagaceae bacterium]|nr:hypothetical protein [Holophagaceae bacterium]
MKLTAIIIANDPIPPRSLVPTCFETVLGDPLLLWQLQALSGLVNKTIIIPGDNKQKITSLLSEVGSKFYQQSKIECADEMSVVNSLSGLSASIGSNTRVIILKSIQPMVAPSTLNLLTSTNGILIPEGQCEDLLPIIGPISLQFSALKSALKSLPSDSGFDELVRQIVVETELVRINCDPYCLQEIHTRQDVCEIHEKARLRIVDHWIEAGIAFIDPQSTHIGPRVTLDLGVLIEPNVRLEGKVIVGEGTKIGQGSIVTDSIIGSGVEIRPYCIINDSHIGDAVKIGPFAHLREGTRLDSDVHLGNFVETKMAHLSTKAKANHLSYLGDCEVGEETNIGAGCITCNYDGQNKHKTVIGKKVFVGSDCQLVAPVAVGDGAILGAGTTLTSNAPKDSLVLTRPETKICSGGAKRFRARLQKETSRKSSKKT